MDSSCVVLPAGVLTHAMSFDNDIWTALYKTKAFLTQLRLASSTNLHATVIVAVWLLLAFHY